ncbi:hypothetical protein [Amphibacillus sediminis]|uniref:hypothetical protein n=1 Tax=Amphibacillus sediminis TaxID=360185 RepID=UPI00083340F4|nr:hypothetical protein [Amphibacillus sediminis]
MYKQTEAENHLLFEKIIGAVTQVFESYQESYRFELKKNHWNDMYQLVITDDDDRYCKLNFPAHKTGKKCQSDLEQVIRLNMEKIGFGETEKES